MFIKTKKLHPRRGFTLVEMLITLTIFGVVGTICTYTMISAVRSAKKIQAEAYLYSEAQAMMDRIAHDAEKSTVDYEAYYSRNVLSDDDDDDFDTLHYGFYAQSFYNPGTGGSGESGPYENIADDEYYGANCGDGSGAYPDDCPDGIPVDDELDRDTGTHPFIGMSAIDPAYDEDPASMNAFCEYPDGSSCDGIGHSVHDELILINGLGDLRTVYKSMVDAEIDGTRLYKLQMIGTDDNSDGVINHWANDPKYGSGFEAITPSTLNIEEFYVYIAPLEDPYRASGEADVQIQPQITIVLKVGLSEDYAMGLLGEGPTILLQRTISTGVYSKIKSYE